VRGVQGAKRSGNPLREGPAALFSDRILLGHHPGVSRVLWLKDVCWTSSPRLCRVHESRAGPVPFSRRQCPQALGVEGLKDCITTFVALVLRADGTRGRKRQLDLRRRTGKR
jgi:hypothetical protein